MRIIDDFVDDFTEKFYKDKAGICRVSLKMVRKKRGENSISICTLLRFCNDKIGFDTLVRQELDSDRKTDFYDFSLLMGQFFGVYNLYSYVYVDREIRRKIMSFNHDFHNTKNLLEKNKNKIFEYLSSKYDLTLLEYESIINKMFTIVNDFSIYNNDIVREVGKILMGSCLYAYDYFNGDNSFLINCGDAVNYFDECNEEKIKGNVK